MRRPSASTVLAAAALFVALGGPAEAAKLISGSQIRASTITGKQVKARSLALSDLSLGARKTLTATPARSIGAAQLATGAVTGPAIADGSVSAADLLPGAVGAAGIIDGGVGTSDLADGAVSRSKIAADAVDGARIADASLAAKDIGRFAGTLEGLDFGTIAVGACKSVSSTSLTPLADTQDVRDDAIVVTPQTTFPAPGMAISARPAGANQIEITICNVAAPADPVNVGARSFRYLTIDVG